MTVAKRFLVILALTLASLLIALPSQVAFKGYTLERPGINVNLGRFSFTRDLELKLGLDLAGGSHLAFEADMKDIALLDREDALESARATIERRVNLFGVSEAVVQTSRVGDSYRVIAELPGVKDTQEAIDLIGQTAQLEFRELERRPPGVDEEEPAKFINTGLTGADLVRTRVEFDQNTGKPVVAIQFSQEGAQKFKDITAKNINLPLAIYIDEQLISAPTVQQEIAGGNAVITGDFSLEEANQLSVQLNSGALPVPVHLIEQRTVEASLGAEAVRKSVVAGLVGLSMVVLFMTAYYGRLGFLASTALGVYGVLTLAIYKLIPVVLTLSGVAGFILSVGMAVDANILIFERMKEELRRGLGWQDSMELGFGRAWDSIRDANIATLLTVFILFNPFDFSFLNTSGPVRGFALTLGLGIFVSLFTGIFVTRTLLRVFARKSD